MMEGSIGTHGQGVLFGSVSICDATPVPTVARCVLACCNCLMGQHSLGRLRRVGDGGLGNADRHVLFGKCRLGALGAVPTVARSTQVLDGDLGNTDRHVLFGKV